VIRISGVGLSSSEKSGEKGAGVASSRLERSHADALGIPHAVASTDALIASPAIDVVEKPARSGPRVALAPANRAVPLLA
jgi:hypothetical protein